MIRANLTRDSNRRAANALFSAKDSRAELARREMAEAVAARDANMARLRALRLEKERLDALAGTDAPVAASPECQAQGVPRKKAIRRINCG